MKTVTPIFAFICTGPSEGFDPLCNGTHTLVLLAAPLLAFALVTAVLVRSLRSRYPNSRWLIGLVAGGLSMWAVGGALLSAA